MKTFLRDGKINIKIRNSVETSNCLNSFYFQSSTEARCLADQVELYYSRPSAARLDILTKFTSTPTLFSHDDLIAEMNSIQIQDTAAAEVNN